MAVRARAVRQGGRGATHTEAQVQQGCVSGAARGGGAAAHRCSSPLSNATRVLPSSRCSVTVPSPRSSWSIRLPTRGFSGTGSRAMAKLKPGGHYVTITGALAPRVRAGRHQAMFINSDTNLASAPLLEALRDLAAAGHLRMPRLQTFGLDAVADGFKASEGGHVVGKVSIQVRK